MTYKNKEIRRAYMERWNKAHPEYKKQWRKNHPGYDKMIYKDRIGYLNKWKKDNSDKMKGYREKWNVKNPGYNSQYHKSRRKTDLRFNLDKRMKISIRKALKGNKKGRKWEALVGYTLYDLIKRLKRTMPTGYTWKDLFAGKLHIDHKIPISVFNFTKPEHIDFRRC
jgi:hypothetical protein